MARLRLKQFVLYLAASLLGMLLIACVLALLLQTEPALNWSMQQAQRLSNGRLSLHAVHGSLYGPLHIESLSFQTDTMRIEVKDAMLDWSPRSLLKRQLQIDHLSMQELKIIQIKPGTATAGLPATLHLPLLLTAPDIKIDRVIFKQADAELLLKNISFSADNSAAHYHLNLHNVDSEWGKAAATMVLGDTRPYTVAAHASMQQQEGWIYRAEADASGSLAQLLLNAQINTLDGQAAINATFTPLEEIPLAAAHITASGINPARLRKDLPTASLGADMSVLRKQANSFEGQLTLRNESPGTWDKSRVPLRKIAVKIAGTAAKLDLTAIELDLGKGGNFNGAAQLRGKQLQLMLNTRNFNPQGVYSKLHNMRLPGSVGLQAAPDRQQLTAAIRYQNFRLQLDTQQRDGVLELRSATLKSAGSSLALHGTLSLHGRKKFQLAAALQKFNPADFGDYPEARLNASLAAAGQLAATAHATLEFALADSDIRLQPLSGHGSLSLSASRMWNTDVLLQLAHNRAEIKGGLGKQGDALSIMIEADSLAEIAPELGGQVRATAKLTGKLSAPSGHVEVQASDLSWRENYRIAKLQLAARLDEGADATLALDANLQDLSTPRLHLDLAAIKAQGSLVRHTLQFSAKNPEFDMESHFAGGWHGESGWAGQVTDISNRGRHAFSLKSPAKLEIGRNHFLLGNAAFDFLDANIVLHELAYADGKIASSGEFKELPLAYLQSLSEQSEGLKTDLRLNGDWQFAVAEQINGHLALWRERGDIFLPTAPQTALGLKQLSLNIDAAGNQLQGRLVADGSTLGKLKADAQVLLAQREGVWGIAASAPLRANASLSIESLAWIAPLLNSSNSLAVDGAIKAEVHASGSFAQPLLTGSISGDRLTLALQQQGLRFSDGSFQMQLQDRSLRLEQLTMHGGSGTLSGQGHLTFAGGTSVMQLALKADKLEVLALPERHLILSGSANASASGNKLNIEASLKADQGLFELPKDDELTASDDVIVLGETTPAEKNALPYALNFVLDLDLGERFYVKGKGLDAQLDGTLRLMGNSAAMPSSRGNIRVVKGSYTAYGQRLVVERGILNFQGPLDNPGLNIVAMRKNQTVEAGVSVSGTALLPRVKLVSNPDVPDSEKLSWLVLGHGLENSSGQDFNALNAAAAALLNAGESITLQQKIAHATGFEEVSLRGDGKLEGTVLSLGKRLSSRAYLSYEQGLSGASSLVKVNYTLTRRVSVQAQAGSTPAMDLFYTFRFD